MNDIAMELVTGVVDNPGGTFTDMTPANTNSFVVRDSKRAQLISTWSMRHESGALRIRSPLLHDAVLGMQWGIQGAGPNVQDLYSPQELTSQDTLTVQGKGGANTPGELELSSYLVFYEALAGIRANLITAEELKRRYIETYAFSNVINPGDGSYSADTSIIAVEDQLKANQFYAILGATLAEDVATVQALRWISPDWGNLGVGVPMMNGQQADLSASFFVRLSEQTGLPTIPVFNASNKALVSMSAIGDEDSSVTEMYTQCARIKGK